MLPSQCLLRCAPPPLSLPPPNSLDLSNNSCFSADMRKPPSQPPSFTARVSESARLPATQAHSYISGHVMERLQYCQTAVHHNIPLNPQADTAEHPSENIITGFLCMHVYQTVSAASTTPKFHQVADRAKRHFSVCSPTDCFITESRKPGRGTWQRAKV